MSKRAIIDIKKLNKSYPGVQALNNVDITVEEGECHAIVGENGAGKSTLVKIISGNTQADDYKKFNIMGSNKPFKNTRVALDNGLATVQQHTNVVPYMSVAENIFLGNEEKKNMFVIDKKKMIKKAKEFINQLGVDLNPTTEARKLEPGDMRIVEICKAKAKNSKIMILDEPTAGLTDNEIVNLFSLLKEIKKQGVTILYISHRLEEIFEIADSVTVLRNGKKISTEIIEDIDHDKLSHLIIGRDMEEQFPKIDKKINEVKFEVSNLTNKKTSVQLKDISFKVNAGEIVSIYGIMGSGKKALCDSIFGLKPIESGEIRLNNEKLDITKPKEAIDNKIAYLTSDRAKNGFIKNMSLRKNATLPALKKFTDFGKIYQQKEKNVVKEYIDSLNIKTRSTETKVEQLSGGNQQKVVFSKWLIADAEVLLLSEPTVGVDIGAKSEMFDLMNKEAKKGRAVLHVTSEPEEAIGTADRLLVIRNGKIDKELNPKETKKDELLKIATKK